MNGSKVAIQCHLGDQGWLAISRSISLSLTTIGVDLNTTTSFVFWMAQFEKAAKGIGGMLWVLLETSMVESQGPVFQYTRWPYCIHTSWFLGWIVCMGRRGLPTWTNLSVWNGSSGDTKSHTFWYRQDKRTMCGVTMVFRRNLPSVLPLCSKMGYLLLQWTSTSLLMGCGHFNCLPKKPALAICWLFRVESRV